jgi:hypothetical protein
MITIKNGRILNKDISHRFQADVGEYQLWFDFPATQSFHNQGDALLSAALMPAMKTGQNIIISDEFSISPSFYARLDELQSIFNYWFPKIFKKISVTCRQAISSPATHDSASFFSGGVDSLYTAINQPDINHLIFIHGVDMQLDNLEQHNVVLTANKELAIHLNKQLIPVVSNVRQYITSHGFSWHYGQGGGLTSIGHLLGFYRTYIPSSDSIDGLHPFGSHPITDPMWSSTAVQFIYQGIITRLDKTRLIVQDQFFLDRLRVCWMDDGYNCGKCIKCLRTMTSLHLLGVKSKAFPEFSADALRKLELYGTGELQFLQENLLAATAVNDHEIHAVINNKIRWMLAKDKLRRLKQLLMK